MAITFIDGFDHAAPTEKGWTFYSTVLSTYGTSTSTYRTGTRSLIIAHQPSDYGQSGNVYAYRSIASTQFVAVAAGYAYSSAKWGVTFNGPIYQFLQGGVAQMALRLNAGGTLSIVRGRWLDGTVLKTSATGLGPGWNHIEFATKISSTAGTAVVYLNGVQLMTLDAGVVNTQNTGSATVDQLALGTVHTGTLNPDYYGTAYWDDLVLADGSNSQGQIGPVSVYTLYPSGDGSSIAWTRSQTVGTDIAPGQTTLGTAASVGAVSSIFDSNNGTSCTLAGTAAAGTTNTGVDFQTATTVYGYKLVQTATTANAATAYKIQGSTNNSTWVDVHTVASGAGADSGSVTFSSPGTYRYWRVLATAGGSSNWIVFTLELYNNTSTNASAVNEAISTGDTLYVTSATTAQRDLYTLTDLPSGITGTVKAVAVNNVVRDDAGGSSPIRGLVKLSGAAVDTSAASMATSATYTARQSIFETVNGSSVTISDVNGMEAGLETA